MAISRKNTPQAPVDDNDIETQAITWVVRLTSGEISKDELSHFRAWRLADSRHEAALNEARQLWVNLGTPLEHTALNGGPLDFPANEKRRVLLRWQTMLPLTALLIAMSGLGQTWLTHWRYDQSTSVGEQRELQLDDGNRMWLDTDSAVDLWKHAGQQFIRLARGEAFFDVTRSPLSSLVVETDEGEVKAHGATFAIQRTPDDMVVTVELGEAQILRKNLPSVVLQANQQAHIRNDSSIPEVITLNARQALAWRNGQLMFRNQKLSDILDVLKRYDKRMMIYSDSNLSQIRLNAIIDISHLDDWYDGLEKVLPVNIKRVGPVIILYHR